MSMAPGLQFDPVKAKMNQKGKRTLPNWEEINAIVAQENGRIKDMPPFVAASYIFFKDKEATEAITRYVWNMLPIGLDGKQIERILYYRGQCCIFYLSATKKFYALPFAFCGSLDCNGRYSKVTPLPFHGATEDKDENGKLVEFIPGLELEVIYSVDDIPDEWSPEMFEGKCVIINDRPITISQKVTPRYILNDGWNYLMAEGPALARTNLIINNCVKALRIPNENNNEEAEALNDIIENAALTCRPFIGATSMQDIQDITAGGRADAEQFFQAMQSFDNIRLMGFGLRSNGMFDKENAYVNNQQVGNMQQNVGLIYKAGLDERQKAAMIIMFATGFPTDCFPSEVVTNTDDNQDGIVGDNNESDDYEQTDEQEQPVGGETENDV